MIDFFNANFSGLTEAFLVDFFTNFIASFGILPRKIQI